MRDNKIIIYVGTRGTGKTDDLKKIVEASNLPKKLVVDTFDSMVWHNLETHDHPEWKEKEVPIAETSNLARWNSGTYRIFSSDTDAMMSAIQKDVKNCLLVFEDATKYVRSTLQADVRKFVLDSKQKNLDVIFVFHSLTSVPRELARISDILVIKRTNESLTTTLKQKFPVADFETAFNKVKTSDNRYTKATIRLN